MSVVDERSELGMCVQGIAQCDLGMRTDLLDGCPKAAGISMMLRSMAPQVLAVDEIGTKEDLEAVRSGMNCGCRILATAHGASVEELRRKAYFSELIKEGLFSRYIVLCQHPAPGTVAGIYDDKLRPLFEDSDFTLVNLECALTDHDIFRITTFLQIPTTAAPHADNRSFEKRPLLFRQRRPVHRQKEAKHPSFQQATARNWQILSF